MPTGPPCMAASCSTCPCPACCKAPWAWPASMFFATGSPQDRNRRDAALDAELSRQHCHRSRFAVLYRHPLKPAPTTAAATRSQSASDGLEECDSSSATSDAPSVCGRLCRPSQQTLQRVSMQWGKNCLSSPPVKPPRSKPHVVARSNDTHQVRRTHQYQPTGNAHCKHFMIYLSRFTQRQLSSLTPT